ncbi:MAG TPA: hypothetical protein VGM11_14250 [Acidobacteriaceae bacterium]
MNKSALASTLILAPLLLASKKDPTQYPIVIHVQCSYLRSGNQQIGVSIDGKAMELTAPMKYVPYAPLPLGDYKARLIGANGYDPPAEYYEVLLPSGKTSNFSVTGLASTVCPVPPQ